MAAGGMAEIFLARQWGEAGFCRDVVIKRLFPYFAENPYVLRMFQDEARLLSELSHPNIPQVFELGHTDGYWYLAMEHVAGFSLVDVCRAAARESKFMPLGVAIGIVAQVCAALHHAHEGRDREGRPLRIVHCDVTPHNIMVTLDGVVKVFDFGVAQTAARLETDAGIVRGTYAYMAPEQVRGKPLDKRADVFALAVVLYELTTGRRLYEGNDVQVMTAVVERDAPPPSSIVPAYPSELEEIVLAALGRDRAQRTPSAAHLLMSLEQFCLRNALVTAPLVISRYVRSLYPYERAHEAGMGMVSDGVSSQAQGQASSGSEGFNGEFESVPPGDVEELEEKLLVEELRRLGQSVPGGEEYLEQYPAPLALPDEKDQSDVIELSGEDLMAPDADQMAAPGPGGEQRMESPMPDRLGLDEFDEDSEVNPVVVLSPKPKTADGRAAEGEFVSNLERRLQKEENS